MTLEKRIEKLEQQMQKRIERSNLIFNIISKQSECNTFTTRLLIPLLPAEVDFSSLAQLYRNQIESYQQLKQSLPSDDTVGIGYLDVLIDDLQQIHCQLTEKK